ncbi:MAG: hypothetical protein WCJ11_03190 [Methylococcaceae bacterium]
MKKIAQKTLLSLLALTAFESAFALDSGAQNLTTTIGATDYFKITCAGDTDHLNFKLFENGVTAAPVVITELPPTLPQVLNVTLAKLKLTAATSAIAAGTNKEVALKGGNGAYTLTLDTFGTNLTLKTAQTYSVQYQCLNAAKTITAGSSTLVKLGVESTTKSLANNKTAKYAINCTGKTDSLKVKIINKTAAVKPISPIIPAVSVSSGNLTAQVIKGANAQNTIGDVLDIQEGNGDYSVMVNSPINAAKTYSFQYSCLNTKNFEAKTSPFQLLQNQ